MAQPRTIHGELQEYLGKFEYSLRETSYLGLRPGDLIQISYNGSFRQGLVVSSKRTSSGMFVSSRLNALLNIVLLDSISEGMFSLMVNNLYKNSNACNYNSPNIIGAFLGKKNFRTFNTSYINNILKVEINQ